MNWTEIISETMPLTIASAVGSLIIVFGGRQRLPHASLSNGMLCLAGVMAVVMFCNLIFGAGRFDERMMACVYGCLPILMVFVAATSLAESAGEEKPHKDVGKHRQQNESPKNIRVPVAAKFGDHIDTELKK